MRKALAGRRGITEKRMFGGVCFLLRGHMLCATGRNGFMFRVGKEQHSQALTRGAAPVVLGGRGFQGFVWVDPAACDARALQGWIVRAEDYVSALPPKRRTGR
jgi:TfoX/Sxy family transcriptional regulator of competence genes